ncbi:MAG: uracil-DNA glycosylase [Candidatus Latescibacterota bacterium]|nr:uracil-DNA glycosylase [Candidatus Latescibacterota bacterium]
MRSWVEAIPLLREGGHLSLLDRVAALRQNQTVYPPQNQIFRALELTPFNRVKVVLLGQDPYHGADQAHGLAFSVPEGTKAPPSLRNIFKEIAADIYGDQPPEASPDLTRWARQGVLLLNTVLTVEEGRADSHQHLGWQVLTDQIVEKLNEKRRRLVFLLWGRHAQQKAAFIDRKRHLVLAAVHPSPLSAYRGFFGCRHFSRANQYLELCDKKPIRW